jgi:hypothetical protein
LEISELVLGFFGILVGIILFVFGFYVSWYLDRRQRKENAANAKILKELSQYIDARIRIGDSKDGKIVKNADGTIAIEWKKELAETAGFVDSVKTVLTKGKN